MQTGKDGFLRCWDLLPFWFMRSLVPWCSQAWAGRADSGTDVYKIYLL